MSDEILTFGPAMQALTPLQRNFVLAMIADPFGNPTRWAKRAGYRNSEGGMRVRGHHLIHDPAIEAAALEYAQGRMRTVGPALAIEVMFRAAANPKHPKQLRAAEMIANRVGLHETTEHVVNVNHSDRTGAALAARIQELAGKLGMDVSGLLGVNAAPRQIEGEIVHDGIGNARAGPAPNDEEGRRRDHDGPSDRGGLSENPDRTQGGA